jgi:SP family sugar:H+ symporter-like MFS transporter
MGLANPLLIQLIQGAVNVLFTSLGTSMVERFCRRNWLIGGALLQFACWMVFASLGTFQLPISGVNPTQEQVG